MTSGLTYHVKSALQLERVKRASQYLILLSQCFCKIRLNIDTRKELKLNNNCNWRRNDDFRHQFIGLDNGVGVGS